MARTVLTNALRGAVLAAVVAGSPAVAATSPKAPVATISQTIPAAFRGRWDESIADKCRERDVNYTLQAATLSDFEVTFRVERVKVFSPTEIEIFATSRDPEQPPRVTIGFTLVDGGKAIVHRGTTKPRMRKCPG